MLFYASLFLFCVAVSCVSLWMYRSLNSVGKAVYRVLLPSSKSNENNQAGEREGALTTNEARVPWGWSRETAPRRRKPLSKVKAARQAPTVPWGWPGNQRNERSADDRANRLVQAMRRRDGVESETSPQPTKEDEPRVGWPYRDEAFEFAGKQYKVVHASGPVGNTNMGGMARPWGW